MTVIVDNTGFNVEYWSRFNEAEFIEQNLMQGVFRQYDQKDRTWLLKETFKLLQDDFARNAEAIKRI